MFSLTSLTCALCLAVLFLVIRRRQRNRPIRIKTIARALLPKRITTSPSCSADVGYFFFSIFVFGLILGWAVLSYQVLSNLIIAQLVTTFGAVKPTPLPEFFSRSVITVALFLAYELGYWLDHYLSHKVPILWEFHKVHHSAEVLSPLTNFRVHPVDTLVFYNILALIMGSTAGLVHYWLGTATPHFTIGNSNVLTLIFFFLIGHLQHSHFWIAFTGVWGRLFLSPAHHQIHHST